jgi:hypothetical protein
MTTAKDNAVRASLERAKDEHRVHAAGARYADDLYVGRIVQTVRSRKVCTRIGTPVAAKCNY